MKPLQWYFHMILLNSFFNTQQTKSWYCPQFIQFFGIISSEMVQILRKQNNVSAKSLHAQCPSFLRVQFEGICLVSRPSHDEGEVENAHGWGLDNICEMKDCDRDHPLSFLMVCLGLQGLVLLHLYQQQSFPEARERDHINKNEFSAGKESSVRQPEASGFCYQASEFCF